MKKIGHIEIEQGEYFLALNYKTNTLYLANNKSDSILVIDGASHKIISRISIEKPRNLVINSKNNILYSISGHAGFFSTGNGARISIIDTTSNQIIGSIGKKEKFRDIKLNQSTNLLYATKPKSKKIWIIDSLTQNIVNKINVKGKYNCLAIDDVNNVIYLGGERVGFSDALSIISVHGVDNHIEKIAKKILSTKIPEELYHNHLNNKLYVKTLEPQDHDSAKTRIHIVDLESKSFCKTSEHRDYLEGMGYDHNRNRIYFSNTSKGEFSIYNDSLEEIGLFRFTESEGFVDKYFSGHRTPTKITINSKLNLIYITDGEKNILHIMKE